MLTVILTIFCCCLLVERLFPGWKLPDVPTWSERVVLLNLVQLGVVLIAGISWEVWLSSSSVFKLSSYFGPITGGLFAYFIDFTGGIAGGTNPISFGGYFIKYTIVHNA